MSSGKGVAQNAGAEPPTTMRQVPDPHSDWTGKISIYEAIKRWDSALWKQLDDVIVPPGSPGKRLELVIEPSPDNPASVASIGFRRAAGKSAPVDGELHQLDNNSDFARFASDGVRVIDELQIVEVAAGTATDDLVPAIAEYSVYEPWARKKHQRFAWQQATELLKEHVGSGRAYVLVVLDIERPDHEPRVPRDDWIEAIRPKEVDFEKSQIRRNKKVFTAFITARSTMTATRSGDAAQRAHRGGRPPIYDWEGFHNEITRIALVEGELPDRHELHRQMTDFVSRWSRQPEESEIRKRLSRLYNTPGILP
jgi:hypothetical protein